MVSNQVRCCMMSKLPWALQLQKMQDVANRIAIQCITGHSIKLDASIPASLYIKQSKPHHLYPPAAAIICKYSEFLSTHSYVLHNTHIRVRFLLEVIQCSTDFILPRQSKQDRRVIQNNSTAW